MDMDAERMPPIGRRVSIAAIVLVANDEERIAATLESLEWVDVRLAVDLGSTDGSMAACAVRGARRVAPGELAWVLSGAGVDWLLLLEGHEVVPPQLAREIREVTAASPGNGGTVAYAIGCDLRFWGCLLRAGARLRAGSPRLLRRDAVRWPTQVASAEQLGACGRVRRLGGRFDAEPYASLRHYVSRMDVLTTAAARAAHQAGERVRWADLVLRPVLRGICLALQLTLRNGSRGLIFAVLEGYRLAVVAAKRWELERAGAPPESM